MAEYEREKEQIQQKAEELERDAQNHLLIHQGLASSVTMFQIAIGVGAISALMRRRGFWLASLAVGAVGLYFLIQSLVTTGVEISNFLRGMSTHGLGTEIPNG